MQGAAEQAVSKDGGLSSRRVLQSWHSTTIDGWKSPPRETPSHLLRGTATLKTLSATVVRWMLRRRRRRKVTGTNGVGATRQRSTTPTNWSWELVCCITEMRLGCCEASRSAGSAAHGDHQRRDCLQSLAHTCQKTRACALRRLTRGEEPNRKTVWPSDTPVIPKRIYISPPEQDGSIGVPR